MENPLIQHLVQEGWLKTEKIIKAFKKIKREDFLPEQSKSLAGVNRPLSIGHGQTISQPLVVAFMLELLQPRAGEKVLDIGSGSGWTTALLAELVGKKGKVIGLEIIPELAKFGKKNVSQYSFIKKGRVEILNKDGKRGYKKEAPFDKMLVSAQSNKLAKAWKKQLKAGGRIVAPINNSISLFIKKEEGQWVQKEHNGFVFVPLK